MHLALAVLAPLTILISWLRMFGLGSHRVDGTVIGTMPIPLLARIYMHAIPAGVATLVTLIAVVSGAMPWWWLVVALLSAAGLIALPLRYTLTDKGIRRTFGRFRRWTEFAGVERAHGGARLKPLRKSPPARIWLSGSRGDDEFLHLLRTLIRNAYQGRSGLPPFPGAPKPAGQEGAPVEPSAACAVG